MDTARTLLPPNEAERLAALRRYAVLDTPPEEAFDDLTRIATLICGTPISTLTLVDAERQWFKSAIGLASRETPRSVAFCAHAILHDEMLIVPDATRDPRFADNPFVLGDPGIRFYAGARLTTLDGCALGTLCVIDRVPRTLTDAQRTALQALSRQAMAQLELRRHLIELQAAYMRLHDLDRLKDEFVSMVSHELRTPLTSIQGALQLVLANPDALADPDDRALLDAALSSGARLVRMTNDILDLAKIEAGRLELRRAACDMADIVASACAAVAHLPYGAGRVRALAPATPETLTADADRLVQALVNLLGNALKFSPPDACVTIEAERVDDVARFTVRDCGPGLTPEQVSRLFQPFQQLENGQRIAGTGLGLVITKGIVEQHGGTVAVDSAPGRGTSFTIAIPAPHDR